MWRIVFWRSQNASRNLAVTGITKKKTQSPSLTSLSRFSFLDSGNASAQNIRFFSRFLEQRSLDAEGKNLLAQFFARILASLAREFPKLGRHYRKWAAGNRIMDFVTFWPRGFTPRRGFTETEAVIELGRMLALLVFFVFVWYWSPEAPIGPEHHPFKFGKAEEEVETARKILEVVSIPPITYPEERRSFVT
ncbi:unnamed protein product [Arabis nemorensis]|uniref:Uncharacterized protein n=1 Tax=Arabis nemorensis TaxID=586526 RepID=A0A565B3H4_9BRAS|nr:unnamed protein product [Arabis nemorensis]